MHQAPLSMGFSRREHWSELRFPPLEDLPNPGTEPLSLISPVLAGRFFITSTTWEAPFETGFIAEQEGPLLDGKSATSYDTRSWSHTAV